jgi:hypothetical protein
MYTISDQQIDFILADLRHRGIRTEDIEFNLLDHICILIEQGLDEGGDFNIFYSAVIRTFYREELYELEEEARFLSATKGPYILLNRSQFFLLLFIVLIGPFIAWGLSSHGLHAEDNWSEVFVFSLFPLLTFLVLLLTPERFDPLIPRRSRIILGTHPLIRILPDSSLAATHSPTSYA